MSGLSSAATIVATFAAAATASLAAKIKAISHRSMEAMYYVLLAEEVE